MSQMTSPDERFTHELRNTYHAEQKLTNAADARGEGISIRLQPE